MELVSSHPPLGERIARLEALIGAVPGAAAASGATDDQQKAKWTESVQFVRNLATTDPEVAAKVMQSALLASETGRQVLNPNVTGIGLPDSPAKEALEVEALTKVLGQAMAGMQQKKAASRPAAAERPSGSGSSSLFWIAILAIAISAGAIVAVLASK